MGAEEKHDELPAQACSDRWTRGIFQDLQISVDDFDS